MKTIPEVEDFNERQKYIKDHLGELLDDAIDEFNNSKEYDKALECFKKLAAEKPSDKTAAYYISLLENFFCKGKYPVEQDGVGVEYMREDGVFKLLQK